MGVRLHSMRLVLLVAAVVEILRVIISVLKDVLGKAPSAALLLDKYARLCLVVDEVINEVRTSQA